MNISSIYNSWMPIKLSNGDSMYRRPVQPSTRRQVDQALDVVMRLLESGPSTVTVVAVATALGRSVDWVYSYLGAREALVKSATVREVGRMCSDIQRVNSQLPPAARVRNVLEVMLPEERYRACLWAIVLANRFGLGSRGRLAAAISNALAEDWGPYKVGIGGGILGVLGEAVGTAWMPSRDELLLVAIDMAVAVHFHAKRDRGGRAQIILSHNLKL